MRSSTVKAFAAGVFATTAFFLCAPHAKADTDAELRQYALDHEALICHDLAMNPTVAGVWAVLDIIDRATTFDAYESGQIVGTAVTAYCPEMWPLLNRFVAIYASTNTPSGVTV